MRRAIFARLPEVGIVAPKAPTWRAIFPRSALTLRASARCAVTPLVGSARRGCRPRATPSVRCSTSTFTTAAATTSTCKTPRPRRPLWRSSTPRVGRRCRSSPCCSPRHDAPGGPQGVRRRRRLRHSLTAHQVGRGPIARLLRRARAERRRWPGARTAQT
jgi:hypothetical protein